MKSPCRFYPTTGKECELLHQSKNNKTCFACKYRKAYYVHIEDRAEVTFTENGHRVFVDGQEYKDRLEQWL